MDLYDEMNGLFRSLGMSEAQARVAAIGRGYRSEQEAREAWRDGDAEGLAEELLADAEQVRPGLSKSQRELQQLSAAIPMVHENTVRILSGQQPMPYPGQVSPAASPAAEAVADAAQTALRMTASEAHEFAGRLQDRESRRGGAEHAEKFLTTFAATLRKEVREVAAR